MIPLYPLLAAVFSLLTSVNGLGLYPANGRTDLVIRVDGQVTVKDYRLGDPERLVIDVFGARKVVRGDRFDRIDRGGKRGHEAVALVLNDAPLVPRYVVRDEVGVITDESTGSCAWVLLP